MATYSQVDDTSDDYTEYECTVCLNNNKVKNADRYCFDCQKYMCPECLQIHINFGDKHNVLSVSDKRVQKILTEKCEDHPDKVLEFYCRQHDAVLCQTCLLIDHRACKDVKHIGESVDDLHADPDMQDIPGHLQAALDYVNQVIESLDKHVEHLREKEEVYINRLEVYLRHILSKIEGMRKRGIDHISETYQKLTTKAKDCRQACKDIKADLSTYASEINRSKDRKAHLIILQKKSQALTSKSESLYKEFEWMIEETSPSFLFNMALVEELDKCNSLLVEVKKNKFNIRTPQDRIRCRNICGCCCLDDGTIMLSDYTNMKLKCLDPVSSTVTEGPTIWGFYDVCGVCSVGPLEVAVAGREIDLDGITMETLWYIEFYDVAKDTTTRKIDVSHDISCLTYYSGDLFVGSLKSLYVYNMNGKQKQEISKESSGRSLFSTIASISVNKRGDRIYVADRDTGLICLSREGQELFRLTNEQLGLSRAMGVTTDHRNQVLICGYDSQNLVQVTEKGRVIGVTLSWMDGIKNPRWLCFDDVRQKLYVGGYMGHILGFDFM